MAELSPEFTKLVETFDAGYFEYSCGNYDEGLAQMESAFSAMSKSWAPQDKIEIEWDKYLECKRVLDNARAHSFQEEIA